MATMAEFNARCEAEAQEMVDILFYAEMYLGMASRFVRDSDPGYADNMLKLSERSRAVLSKIYNVNTEV
jgi:hypothetical protein